MRVLVKIILTCRVEILGRIGYKENRFSLLYFCFSFLFKYIHIYIFFI